MWFPFSSTHHMPSVSKCCHFLSKTDPEFAPFFHTHHSSPSPSYYHLLPGPQQVLPDLPPCFLLLSLLLAKPFSLQKLGDHLKTESQAWDSSVFEDSPVRGYLLLWSDFCQFLEHVKIFLTRGTLHQIVPFVWDILPSDPHVAGPQLLREGFSNQSIQCRCLPYYSIIFSYLYPPPLKSTASLNKFTLVCIPHQNWSVTRIRWPDSAN